MNENLKRLYLLEIISRTSLEIGIREFGEDSPYCESQSDRISRIRVNYRSDPDYSIDDHIKALENAILEVLKNSPDPCDTCINDTANISYILGDWNYENIGDDKGNWFDKEMQGKFTTPVYEEKVSKLLEKLRQSDSKPVRDAINKRFAQESGTAVSNSISISEPCLIPEGNAYRGKRGIGCPLYEANLDSIPISRDSKLSEISLPLATKRLEELHEVRELYTKEQFAKQFEV